MKLETPSDIARITKTQRQARGLTQKDVAEAVGITRQSLARLERGQGGASVETVLRIFDQLGIRLTAESSSSTNPRGEDAPDQREPQTAGQNTAYVGRRALLEVMEAAERTLDPTAAAKTAAQSFDTSAIAAAIAQISKSLDTSAITKAAAQSFDTSAIAAAIAQISRNLDTTSFQRAAAQNVYSSAIAAARRDLNTSVQANDWRAALDESTIQLREQLARTGGQIDSAHARAALVRAAIEAGDPDRIHNARSGAETQSANASDGSADG